MQRKKKKRKESLSLSSRCPQGTYFYVVIKEDQRKRPKPCCTQWRRHRLSSTDNATFVHTIGLLQLSTFNCLRTRSTKRLAGTHVTVVSGPCASSQTRPSILRKKKPVHHPGLAPDPQEECCEIFVHIFPGGTRYRVSTSPSRNRTSLAVHAIACPPVI